MRISVYSTLAVFVFMEALKDPRSTTLLYKCKKCDRKHNLHIGDKVKSKLVLEERTLSLLNTGAKTLKVRRVSRYSFGAELYRFLLQNTQGFFPEALPYSQLESKLCPTEWQKSHKKK